MRWIGLTGGIASGKSTVARLLIERGAKVIDADALAREVVAPGTPGLALIAARWPEVVIDGALDRKALGKKIFADAGARKALEAIVHPLIAGEAQARARVFEAAGEERVIYEAALIVENDLDAGMDGLIVVSVPEAVQLERLVSREGMSEAEARMRIQAQVSPAERLARATWIVDNSGELAQTGAQIDAVWKAISEGSGP